MDTGPDMTDYTSDSDQNGMPHSDSEKNGGKNESDKGPGGDGDDGDDGPDNDQHDTRWKAHWLLSIKAP